MILKITLIVLLSVWSIESKVPIPTRSECEWGVSYWCQSRDIATRCGQLEYCQSIWKDSLKKESTELYSIECVACDIVVRLLKVQIDKNSTEADVKNATLSLCDAIPPIESKCRTIVNDNFSALWKDLQNEIDPSELCDIILSCSTSSAITNKQYFSVNQVGNVIKDLECKICKAVIGHYDDPGAIEQKLENKLDAFCLLMPKSNEKKECTGLIKIILDTLKNDADKLINSDLICTKMGYCDALDGSVSLKNLAIGDGKCDFCKLVVHFLKPYIDLNITEVEVKEALNSICNLLPKSTQCTDFIDEYFDIIWLLMINEFDNDAICDIFDLCNQKETKQVQLKSVECDICKLVVKFLKNYIDSNSTEAEVKQSVEKLCQLLPNDSASECTSFIDKYFDTVWGLLKMEVDSDKICEQLGICNDTKVMIARPIKLKSVGCDTCKVIVNFLKQYIDSNSTEAQVKQIVENFCQLLPSDSASKCISFINEYFDTVWGLLKMEVDSGEICEQLGICNDTKVMIARPIKGVVLCTVCELMMKELDKLLESNKTESAVMNALERVCDILPAEYSEECSNITRKYGPTIYKLIIDGGSSKLICGMIGVCTGDLTAIRTTDNVSCNDCHEALKLIKLILTIECPSIVEGMESLCKLLPDAISTECDTLVEEYGKEFIINLVKDMDSLQICKDLDFCSSFTKNLPGTQRITCRSCNDDIKKFENLFSTKSRYFMSMMISSCKNIPEESPTCSTIIKTNGRTIYQKIHSTLMNHHDACQYVCGASHSKKGHPHLAFNAAALASKNNL